MTTALKKRGQVDIELFGEVVRLHAAFKNVELFEQNTGVGFWSFVTKLSNMDLSQTDIVNFIWCFIGDKRDTVGWSKDEINERLFEAEDGGVILRIIEAFMTMALGPITSTDASTPKKTKAIRRVVKK